MPTSFKKKQLGAWPDDKKHQVVKTPQEQDEQSISGLMPDPEEITGAENPEPKDTLDAAKDAGLYSDQDEEHPGELGLAKEEEKDISNE